MRHPLTLAALLAVALAQAGCIEQEEHWTLNPDGSGKVALEHRTLLTIVRSEPGPTVLERARRKVRDILAKAEGVDVWSNVEFEVDEEAWITFRGTAYFRDLNRLRLHLGGLEWNLTRRGDESLVFVFERPRPAAQPFELTLEEALDRVPEQRRSAEQMRSACVQLLPGLTTQSTLELFAEPSRKNGVQVQPDGCFLVEITGRKLIEAFEQIDQQDDAWHAQKLQLAARQGNDDAWEAMLCEHLFGSSEWPSVEVPSTGAPLFDYAAEVERARAGDERLRDSLRIGEVDEPARLEGNGERR